MRFVIAGGILLFVAAWAGWMMPHTAPAKPDQTAEVGRLREQVSQQDWAAYQQQQKREADDAQANWQKMWDDMDREREIEARERRAYERGEADGEGYAEQRPSHR